MSVWNFLQVQDTEDQLLKFAAGTVAEILLAENNKFGFITPELMIDSATC